MGSLPPPRRNRTRWPHRRRPVATGGSRSSSCSPPRPGRPHRTGPGRPSVGTGSFAHHLQAERDERLRERRVRELRRPGPGGPLARPAELRVGREPNDRLAVARDVPRVDEQALHAVADVVGDGGAACRHDGLAERESLGDRRMPVRRVEPFQGHDDELRPRHEREEAVEGHAPEHATAVRRRPVHTERRRRVGHHGERKPRALHGGEEGCEVAQLSPAGEDVGLRRPLRLDGGEVAVGGDGQVDVVAPHLGLAARVDDHPVRIPPQSGAEEDLVGDDQPGPAHEPEPTEEEECGHEPVGGPDDDEAWTETSDGDDRAHRHEHRVHEALAVPDDRRDEDPPRERLTLRRGPEALPHREHEHVSEALVASRARH